MNEIATFIKCLMEETNMTKADLARRAGVSNATITRILKGRTKGSIEGLDKILGVFQCRLAVRRIANLPTDYDPETRKRRLPFDDPLENNPALEKIRNETQKTPRP